jgi:predicted ester cyclase
LDSYRGCIACLNRQGWSNLDRFVRDGVGHIGRPIGVAGYRAMLDQNFAAIPDLRCDIRLLLCAPPHVACRLGFDCTPKGTFLGIASKVHRVRWEGLIECGVFSIPRDAFVPQLRRGAPLR